ncbi:DNA cytosine methyltransferase [Pokkaliibacter sp. CJK22405]|uniref:DNA cytosine methyltransferase n=1 Tax=Pokkaliibacter sp. CJK22405 TaxID=3384615 RepID=UPI003985438D
MNLTTHIREIRHFHLFCGLGGGAAGFNRSSARVGSLEAKFRCIGGVDVDAAAIRDFGTLTGATGTVLDMFDRSQYQDFHGKQPPAEWKEATPQDIQRAAGNERPHIVFLSAPCKGFSGLLNEARSKTAKYQALNRLTLRGIWLMLEAFASDLPEMIIFENVPRIANRGRPLLDQINALLQRYGYAVAETTHDCGEIGGLAQSRKRFLMVARNIEKVPPFLYEPERRPLCAVGDVLSRLPLPGSQNAGPMHRVPSLQWKTWVRLAFVEAGGDWRSLRRLNVKDGYLTDYLIVPEYRRGFLGVNNWHEPVGTVAGRTGPTNGKFSIADPRGTLTSEYAQYGVMDWGHSSGAITSQSKPGGGRFSVADPRPADNAYGVKYSVVPFDKPARTVISGSTTGQDAFAVADPRSGMRGDREHYQTGGHYGVLGWTDKSGAVSASASHDNGKWSIADPRLPSADEKTLAVIQSLDGTWHRPFTTLELAALQGLVDPEVQLELDGLNDMAWRERIGNAVPAPAAEAIGNVMGTTLLLAWSGETFMLSAQPIWVKPLAAALSLNIDGALQ